MALAQRLQFTSGAHTGVLPGACIAALCAAYPSSVLAAAAPAAERFQAPTSALLFILQLGVLILAARLGGMLFRRLKCPSMLGEVAAGILLGPHLLGRLVVMETLIPATGVTWNAHGGLFGVVALALMALMFLTGLATDVRLMRHSSRLGALTVGCIGTGAALLAGCGVVVFLGPRLIGSSANGFAPETLLAGLAVATASIGGVAGVLTRQNRMESPEGGVALSAATVDSAITVLLMTSITGLAQKLMDGQTVTATGMQLIVLKTLVLGFVMWAVACVVARQANRQLDSVREGIAPSVYGLGFALLAGGVGVFLGVSPLLGAYIMGLAFAATDIRHLIQDRLEILHACLLPACCALVGTQIDPTLLANPRVALFALAFTGAGMAAKFIGAGLSARVAGMNAVGCLRVGTSLLPRGELTPIVVLVAFSLGALSPELLLAVAVFFFASGILAPLLVTRAFACGKAGTVRGFAASESIRLVFDFPSSNAAGLVLDRLIALFEDEGFYVNLLHRRNRFYQLLRGGSVLGVQCAGSEIVFTCLARDRDLVNTAMLEVSACMEQCLRELRKPLDSAELRKRLLDDTRQAPEHAPSNDVLRRCLSPSTLTPRLLANDKTGVIGELLDLLDKQGLIRDQAAALAAVLEREQNLATGLENGIAIPHGRTDSVDHLVCAVGLKPGGVDFDSSDGRPTRIVFLVLAPEHASAPQLQLISRICQLMDARGRAALLACDTPDDMHEVLTNPQPGEPRHPRKPISLAWQSIALDLRATTKEEALDQLLALCVRSGAVLSPDEARRDLFARENSSSTGLEHGLALPHTRTAAVERPVCAFGISRAGIAFDSMDGKPVHFFGIVLLPPSATTEYTRIIGVFARALDAEGRKALLAARSSQEVLTLLTTRGGDGL